MGKKKWLGCLMLLFCMIVAAAFPVYAAASVEVKEVSGRKYLYEVKSEGGQTSAQRVTGYKGIAEYPAGSGNYYYFKSRKGTIICGKWICKNQKYYYTGTDGILLKGFQTIKGKKYYLSPTTFERQTGWTKIGKKYYYMTTKGVVVTGWLKLKNATYYLNPNKNGARVTSTWKRINKKAYYFNSSGKLQTGWIDLNGNRYYTNSTGARVTGILVLNGKTYYLDKSSSGAMKTGWITYNGRTYYMTKSGTNKGQAVTGFKKISGYKYYFDTSGVMKTGWLVDGSKRYYMDPSTGRMTTGKKTINGTTYDFGTKGYITVEATGAWSIKVNQGTNVVTIYRGSTPVKALLCSVGLNGATPNGTFTIMDKLRWHELMGPSWGQYCEHITSDILFHSVPYSRYQNPYSLSAASYNKLGTAASHGCIRLNVASAKYIYDNCPVGTKVTVFVGTSADDPLGKPTVAKIPSSQTWDPTDPNL